MRSQIKKINVLFSFLFLLMFVPLISIGQEQIDIQVSPHVLNLQNQGSVVTIHTNKSYSSVDAQSVYLNGVLIQSWKADNQGFFVAKFNMNEIQGLPDLEVGEYNEFHLIGVTNSGEEFEGTEDILIIDRSGKRR